MQMAKIPAEKPVINLPIQIIKKLQIIEIPDPIRINKFETNIACLLPFKINFSLYKLPKGRPAIADAPINIL